MTFGNGILFLMQLFPMANRIFLPAPASGTVLPDRCQGMATRFPIGTGANRSPGTGCRQPVTASDKADPLSQLLWSSENKWNTKSVIRRTVTAVVSANCRQKGGSPAVRSSNSLSNVGNQGRGEALAEAFHGTVTQGVILVLVSRQMHKPEAVFQGNSSYTARTACHMAVSGPYQK
jgi:hypothetical protein